MRVIIEANLTEDDLKEIFAILRKVEKRTQDFITFTIEDQSISMEQAKQRVKELLPEAGEPISIGKNDLN